MELREISAIVRQRLKAAGFEKAGSCWYLASAEILWVVEVETSSLRREVGLEAGIAFDLEARFRHPSDAPIVLYPSHLGAIDHSDVTDAFSLRSGLTDAVRTEAVAGVCDALITYIESRDTVEKIQRAYQDDEFRGSGVVTDAALPMLNTSRP